MKSIYLLALLAACSFPHPEDVTFGEAAITITSGNQQTGISGAELPDDLVVNVTDADLRPIPNFTVEFTVTVGNGTLSTDTMRTDAQGNARVSFTLGRRAGDNEIDVSGEGISSERIFFQHTGLVGPPSRLVAVAGDGQSATVATTIELVTRLEDVNENAIAGTAVDHAITGGGGNLSVATQTTDDEGLVRTVLTIGTTSGANTVEARVPGVTPLVHTVNGTGGVATSFAISSGNNVLANALVPAPIVVIARDAYGNASPGTVVAFTVTAGSGVLGPASVPTDAQGLATSTVTPPSMTGTTTVKAEAPSTGLPFVTFTVPARGFSSSVQTLTATTIAGHLFELGDVNEDGRLDLVYLVDNASVSNVVVRLNTTAPGATTMTFAAESSFSFGAGADTAYDFDVGDLDNDGDADVVVSTNSPTSTRVLANSTGTGAATPVLDAPATVSSLFGEVAIGNLNGDNLNDIAFVDGALHVLRNTTTTSISFASHDYGITVSAVELRIADVNADGIMDIVGGQSTTASILRNTTAAATNPTFALTTATCPTFSPDAMLGDLDGDGKPELIGGSPSGTSSNLDVCRNTTTTTPSFAMSTMFSAGAESVVSVDVNGDGKLDVVGVSRSTNNSLSAAILLSTSSAGTITLNARETFSLGITGAPLSYRTRVADLNGDSRRDLVFETNTGFRVLFSQ